MFLLYILPSNGSGWLWICSYLNHWALIRQASDWKKTIKTSFELQYQLFIGRCKAVRKDMMQHEMHVSQQHSWILCSHILTTTTKPAWATFSTGLTSTGANKKWRCHELCPWKKATFSCPYFTFEEEEKNANWQKKVKHKDTTNTRCCLVYPLKMKMLKKPNPMKFW